MNSSNINIKTNIHKHLIHLKNVYCSDCVYVNEFKVKVLVDTTCRIYIYDKDDKKIFVVR